MESGEIDDNFPSGTWTVMNIQEDMDIQQKRKELTYEEKQISTINTGENHVIKL